MTVIVILAGGTCAFLTLWLWKRYIVLCVNRYMMNSLFGLGKTASRPERMLETGMVDEEKENI